MRQIKVIRCWPKDVQDFIEKWLESEEAQGIHIVSVNGTSDESERVITYILYDELKADKGIQI